MRIESIGHAAILIETKGLRILSDPWWAGPCFGSQWWIYPKACVEPVEAAPVDFIYISHGHVDHLHNGTLSRLPKTAKCLVSSTLDIAEPLERLGFEVWQLDPGERRDLGNGVTAVIDPTCNADTLMVIQDGSATCVNLNDALHAAPESVQDKVIADLNAQYPSIDYVYCGYGIASHFPCCYSIPGKDDVACAIKRQKFFNRQWCSIVHRLVPRFAVPFAADVALLEDDLFWSNEPIHNTERPTDVFRAMYPDSAITVFDAAPGFAIEDGKVLHECLFQPVSAEKLRADYRDEIITANKATKPSDEAVEEIADLLRRNTQLCRSYLLELAQNYRFLITLKEADRGIEIRKTGTEVVVETRSCSDIRTADYDVEFVTRYSYIRRALTQRYGHEVIFVGSGGIFRYRDAARARENIHRELTMLLRLHEKSPMSRFGEQSKLLFTLKNRVKAMLGRLDTDIYDLSHWITGGA